MANILLGVSSSISVYKSLDLVSKLKKDGHKVFAILTQNIQKLISPTLFHNLGGQYVEHDYFSKRQQGTMEHIRLAKLADLMVIYPASANTMAKLTYGLADDLLTTTALAINCPLILFPAMNPTMWSHPATKHNTSILKNREVMVLGPVSGEVACGDFGVGKLMEVQRAYNEITNQLQQPHFLPPSPYRALEVDSFKPDFLPDNISNKRVLLTLGGSIEKIDPVRMITNASSGKMGLNLIERLLEHNVCLKVIMGNVNADVEREILSLDKRDRLLLAHFSSTEDLLQKVQMNVEQVDILIMNAAPGDFKTANSNEKKIKSGKPFDLKLIKNPDVLGSLSKKKGQLFVGFAAETENLQQNALSKLKSKNLDLIIGNRVSANRQPTQSQPSFSFGIGGDFTEIVIMSHKGLLYKSNEPETKKAAAYKIIHTLNDLLN